jgi:hypothetical protein
MEKFRKSRHNEIFALTSPQNPNVELRSLAQMLAAAEKLVEERSSAPPDENFSPEDSAADRAFAAAMPLTEAAAEDALSAPVSSPETSHEDPANPCTHHAPQPEPARQLRKKATFRQPPGSIARSPERALTHLERHERKCRICKHPDREEIDEDILHWANPRSIAERYNLLKHRYVYRHAHATGLMERRRQFMRDALEHIVEQAEDTVPTADAVIRAVQACGRINAQGQWVDPPARVIFSSDVQKHNSASGTASKPAASLPQLTPAIEVQPIFSNRHSGRLEITATDSKRTTDPNSNRHFFARVALKIRAAFASSSRRKQHQYRG